MRKLFILVACMYSCHAPAGVLGVTTNTSKISAVRIESRWGFVSFSDQSISACSNGRVYLNLDNEFHKAAYSTALAAYMSGKKIAIRADDAAPLVFGACQIYDILIYD